VKEGRGRQGEDLNFSLADRGIVERLVNLIIAKSINSVVEFSCAM
jgi:hypothetical protein